MKKYFTRQTIASAAKGTSAYLLAMVLGLLSASRVQAQLNYTATACADPYTVIATQPGTTFVGSGDDVLFSLALPFPFTFYNTTYPATAGSIGVNTNGFIIFNPATNRGFTNANLPTAIAGAAMYPFWDDLQANPAVNPNSGVYTRVDGTAPNRIFTVEWYQIGHFSHTAGQEVTFQVRLFENGNRIQFKYLDVIFGGTQAGFDNGLSATIGLEDVVATPRPFTLVGFNTASVTNGQCIEFVLPQACNPIAGPTQTFNTSPGLCAATATINLPTFNPPGCANGITIGLRYSLNGGPFVNVTLPATSITISVPKGTNVIVWETFVIANGATAGVATQTIIVNDNEPPKLTCPQNIIVNLGPGECCRSITWPEPTATDNCPFLQGPFQLNTINQGGNAGSVGGMVFFNINNTSGQPIVITHLGMRISDATLVNIYVKSGTHVGFETQPAAWNLAGTADATTGPFSGPFPGAPIITTAVVTNPASGLTLGPGLWGIALHTPTAQNIYTNGNGLNQTYSDGNITINLGSAANTLWGAPFTPRVWNGFVRYLIGGPPQIIQTAGPANGSAFCKDDSPFTIRYQVADAAGNTATCSFTITVNPFPNPTNALTCNNNVQISLDQNCSAFVNADQVLEGGPYKCYDDYVVEVDKTLPFGNGPWIRVSQGPSFPGFGAPTPLGPDDVGKTYYVRVTDPSTGQRCWGNITVLDKLPPVLRCEETFIACNASTEPCVDPLTVLPAAPLFTINTANNGNAVGGMVFFNITNNTSLPLEITAIGMNISGPTLVNIYARPGTHVGFETNASVWTLVGSADGTQGPFSGPFPGNGTITPCPLNTPITLPPGTFGIGLHTVTASSNYTNGTGANQTYTDGTITLNLGSTTNAFFAAPVFSPRVWNGFVQYKKIVPPTCLPNGLTLNVNAFKIGDATYRVNRGAGTPVMEPCSDVTLTYVDSSVDEPCSSSNIRTITRKWTARDASGNTATCNQRVNVLRPKSSDIVLPPSYDDVKNPSIPCVGAQYPTPEFVQASGRQGFPLVFGKPINCDCNWTYTDTRFDNCDGTYKIRRRWTIINCCTSQVTEHDQIIKVSDNVGPTLTCPANLTVGTDPFQCCATVDLPDVVVSDNCSRIKRVSAMVTTFDPQTNQQTGMFTVPGSVSDFPGNNYWDSDTLAVVGTTPCLPLGTHTVVYMVEDDCGNTSTCSFRLTVRDLTPPNVSCVEFTVVAIGVDDPADCYGPAGFQNVPPALGPCEFAGVTWVKATTFNNGSYDNCSNLKFTVQRMAPYSDCINNLNAIRGTPNCASLFPSFPSEFERAISEGDSIKFYCCEVGTTQTVIVRAYQVDDAGNFILGQDGTPVRNECMVEVSVQDKIKPLCTPPANVSVSCENFDPSLWAYGRPTVVDNCCLDTTVSYQGQCGLTQTVNLALFDTLCNRGTITRTFRVADCHGNTQTCTQRVFVSYNQNYFVRFPNDVVLTVCDGTGNYGEPTFFGKDCEALGVSFTDQVNTVVPDACFLIERTWTIINWCSYNPNQGCIEVPNPEPNAIKLNPANRPGPVVSPAGTPAPWNPTVVAITPGATPTNYSTFWNANANCYRYKQLIWVVDNQKPEITNCPPSPQEICDVTENNANLWNAMYWWDGKIGSHDLCEAPTDLSITATDLCSGDNLTIRYLLFLDLDGDGTMETVVSSTQTGLGGLGWNRVNYGNANNPNYSGGTPREFDFRPVPANQKWGFALQVTKSGGNVTGAVRWNTQQSQTTYVVPELPYGVHKIKWFVDDMCGNERECEYVFEVKDCKKPTIICKNIGVNIMPTKMITINVSDVLQDTYDNCTPSNLLKVGIRRAGQGTGFPRLPNGQPQTTVTFTCADLGEQNVEVWSEDVAGNADFCVAKVNVQDNMNACSASSATVAGALKTEANQGLEDASVSLTGNGVTMTETTDKQGQFTLAGVPTPGDYVVSALKDNDHLNGVSTFDLVLINKHILGLEPLTSPYKMIAADANNSRSITTFDIVELRKLILGIYTELPNNTSWRFVDKDFVFPDPNNPFKTVFAETKELKNLTANALANNFVAIKVGDVNGSAVPSSLMSADERTVGTLLFDVKDRAVKAGEVFTVTFEAAEVVQGYQFTLNHAGLELVNIEPLTEGMTLGHFGVFAQESAVTTSWDGEVPAKFALTFRARTSGELSRLLGVSGRITKAEAYGKGAERLAVAFRFNGAQGPTITGVGFELYQNQPNPWLSRTQIGFHLPEATEAVLTVYDETGRVLFVQKGQYGKGYNAVTLDRSVLDVTGVLYYELKTSKDSATRKMIQTK